MSRFVSATFAALLLAGCASSPPPEAGSPPAVATCADSLGSDCENGMPLCMMDDERHCQMCQCSAYALAAPPVWSGPSQGPSSARPSQPVFTPITQ